MVDKVKNHQRIEKPSKRFERVVKQVMERQKRAKAKRDVR